MLIPMRDGPRLLRALRDDGARLHVWRDGNIVYRSEGQGIRPLLEALSRETLLGVWFADRVVGKVAALLTAEAGAGFVASLAAVRVLKKAGVPLYYEQQTPLIQGRAPGQPCPFECAVEEVDDPGDAWERLVRLAADILPTPEASPDS